MTRPGTTARDRPPEEAGEDTSLARGLRVLLAVADRGEVRADELSVLLDTPISTVYRYLRTLAEFGFVDRDGGRFRLGPRLLIGSGAAVTSEQLIAAADPLLQQLAASTGETAIIVRRIGLYAVCLHQVESPNPLRVSLEVGAATPLHAGAAARVLLAYAPDEIVAQLVSAGMERVTSATPIADAVVAGLPETRRNGIATSRGELVPGSASVAVPVLRRDGIAAALALIGPAERCTGTWRRRAGRSLRQAAGDLVDRLESLSQGGSG
jgi:DNA-binding IclR family transcriptional regulator